jgi:hypothetical protein
MPKIARLCGAIRPPANIASSRSSIWGACSRRRSAADGVLIAGDEGAEEQYRKRQSDQLKSKH